MKKVKNYIFVFLFSVVYCSITFSMSINDLFKSKNVEEIPIQQKYDGLTELIPSYIMLPANGTSVITQDVLEAIQEKLNRAMVNTEQLKPVLLNKWLIGKYGLHKEKNIFEFINKLSAERFKNCNVAGVCHPFISKTCDGYDLIISFYRYVDNGFPIVVYRHIDTLKDCSKALSAILNEYILLTENSSKTDVKKKKLIIKPFVLESRKYIGQNGSEFDYIPSTFIEQDDIIIRANDDMFSRRLGYSLYTTQMLQVMHAKDLETYVESDFDKYNFADFYIEGRIQLTDHVNIYHISLYDAKNKKELKSVKYFDSEFSLKGMNLANSYIISSLADYLFGINGYGVCPEINMPGQGLYLNNIFIGCDYLDNFILPKGKHIIYTGDYFNKGDNSRISKRKAKRDIDGNIYRSFFVYLDDKSWVFKGKDGERIWNLLEK